MSALSGPLVQLPMFICWLQKTVLAELRLPGLQLLLRQQMPRWTPQIITISVPIHLQTGVRPESAAGMSIERPLVVLQAPLGKSAPSDRLRLPTLRLISVSTIKVLPETDQPRQLRTQP